MGRVAPFLCGGVIGCPASFLTSADRKVIASISISLKSFDLSSAGFDSEFCLSVKGAGLKRDGLLGCSGGGLVAGTGGLRRGTGDSFFNPSVPPLGAGLADRG